MGGGEGGREGERERGREYPRVSSKLQYPKSSVGIYISHC